MSSKRARSAEPEAASDRVTLNVGGTIFETSKSTLVAGSSYFARHFSDTWAVSGTTTNGTETNDLFLDLDHDSFKVLLSCMRRKAALMPADADLFRRVLLDAEFLGCDFLLTEVKETVQRHGAEYVDLLSAFRAGVLPARFFGPASERIRQILPAGEHDRLDLMSSRSADGPIVKRVIAYALVENDGVGQRIEPVIAHHMDEEYHMGNACTLASQFEDMLKQHDGEKSLMNLGVSRYPPTTLGNTVRSGFDHKIVEETKEESLKDAIRRYGAKGYRAIATWTHHDRLKILLERAAPQRAAAT